MLPCAGFAGFPDAHQAGACHYRREKLFSASHCAHAWVLRLCCLFKVTWWCKTKDIPKMSSRRTCQHSGDAHETPLADELGSPLRLPLSPPYATLCLGRAERRPRWRSPASPLPSSPSLSKFWGEQEATKIDGFPHRQQAQAWGSLSARP